MPALGNGGSLLMSTLKTAASAFDSASWLPANPRLGSSFPTAFKMGRASERESAHVRRLFKGKTVEQEILKLKKSIENRKVRLHQASVV